MEGKKLLDEVLEARRWNEQHFRELRMMKRTAINEKADIVAQRQQEVEKKREIASGKLAETAIMEKQWYATEDEMKVAVRVWFFPSPTQRTNYLAIHK